jgi:SanA protein
VRAPVLLAGAAVAGVGAANALVLLGTRGAAASEVEELPHAEAAIVLGALVAPSGRMSVMLADRVRRGLELWRAGKVDRILVSGDHGEPSYDEPGAMRDALLAAGVPASAILRDDAGFDTWATMRRARQVYGVRSAIVVTQDFHMARALYLARRAGLDARGLTADLREYGDAGLKSRLREVLARVKAVGEAVGFARFVVSPISCPSTRPFAAS